LAPALFERLGAVVDCIGCAPDGRNINLNCGSLHLEGLQKRVLETGADVGVAFDGDADRALFVSHSGKIIDGDAVMLVTALRMHAAGQLSEVIATVMSNLGLERALQRHGAERAHHLPEVRDYGGRSADGAAGVRGHPRIGEGSGCAHA
jgi:phosphoglucosamine mutase